MLNIIRRAKQAFTAETTGPRRGRRGLSKLSPEAIGNAINETDKQVNGILLAFIGAAAFCILSLLTPDSALLGSSEKVTVPLAGPVSFVGFIIIGPAVLVLLRAVRPAMAATRSAGDPADVGYLPGGGARCATGS